MSQNPINVNRWQNKVRAILGVRGDNPIPDIDALRPVFVVEADRPEWGFAGGEFLGANGFNQPAVAAQRSWIALVNLDASGLLAVVEDITADSVSQIYVASAAIITAAAAVISTIGMLRDTRAILAPAPQVSAMRFMQGAAAVPPGVGFGPLNRIGAAGGRYSKEIVVVQGTGVLIAGDVVNTALLAHFTWRERIQERGLLS